MKRLKILLLVGTVALSGCNGSTQGTSGPWRALEPFTSVSLGGVAYGPQGFVAVGGTSSEGRIFVSPDGSNWRQVNYRVSSNLNEITYANGLYVAVGGDNTVLLSPDADLTAIPHRAPGSAGQRGG